MKELEMEMRNELSFDLSREEEKVRLRKLIAEKFHRLKKALDLKEENPGQINQELNKAKKRGFPKDIHPKDLTSLYREMGGAEADRHEKKEKGVKDANYPDRNGGEVSKKGSEEKKPEIVDYTGPDFLTLSIEDIKRITEENKHIRVFVKSRTDGTIGNTWMIGLVHENRIFLFHEDPKIEHRVVSLEELKEWCREKNQISSIGTDGVVPESPNNDNGAQETRGQHNAESEIKNEDFTGADFSNLDEENIEEIFNEGRKVRVCIEINGAIETDWEVVGMIRDPRGSLHITVAQIGDSSLDSAREVTFEQLREFNQRALAEAGRPRPVDAAAAKVLNVEQLTLENLEDVRLRAALENIVKYNREGDAALENDSRAFLDQLCHFYQKRGIVSDSELLRQKMKTLIDEKLLMEGRGEGVEPEIVNYVGDKILTLTEEEITMLLAEGKQILVCIKREDGRIQTAAIVERNKYDGGKTLVLHALDSEDGSAHMVSGDRYTLNNLKQWFSETLQEEGEPEDSEKHWARIEGDLEALNTELNLTRAAYARKPNEGNKIAYEAALAAFNTEAVAVSQRAAAAGEFTFKQVEENDWRKNTSHNISWFTKLGLTKKVREQKKAARNAFSEEMQNRAGDAIGEKMLLESLARSNAISEELKIQRERMKKEYENKTWVVRTGIEIAQWYNRQPLYKKIGYGLVFSGSSVALVAAGAGLGAGAGVLIPAIVATRIGIGLGTAGVAGAESGERRALSAWEVERVGASKDAVREVASAAADNVLEKLEILAQGARVSAENLDANRAKERSKGRKEAIKRGAAFVLLGTALGMNYRAGNLDAVWDWASQHMVGAGLPPSSALGPIHEEVLPVGEGGSDAVVPARPAVSPVPGAVVPGAENPTGTPVTPGEETIRTPVPTEHVSGRTHLNYNTKPFDHNEQKLWWGGSKGHEGVVMEGGKVKGYEFDVSHMRGVSSHDTLKLDPQRVMKDGKMVLLLTANDSTDPIPVEVSHDGKAFIPEESPAAKLFSIDSKTHGAVYNGESAEAATRLGEVKDGKWAIFATHVGTGEEGLPTVEQVATPVSSATEAPAPATQSEIPNIPAEEIVSDTREADLAHAVEEEPRRLDEEDLARRVVAEPEVLTATEPILNGSGMKGGLSVESKEGTTLLQYVPKEGETMRDAFNAYADSVLGIGATDEAKDRFATHLFSHVNEGMGGIDDSLTPGQEVNFRFPDEYVSEARETDFFHVETGGMSPAALSLLFGAGTIATMEKQFGKKGSQQLMRLTLGFAGFLSRAGIRRLTTRSAQEIFDGKGRTSAERRMARLVQKAYKTETGKDALPRIKEGELVFSYIARIVGEILKRKIRSGSRQRR